MYSLQTKCADTVLVVALRSLNASVPKNLDFCLAKHKLQVEICILA